MSQLVAFHRGEGVDSEGRTLADLWSFSDDQMESRHDFIQWMFPLDEPSRYNPDAPILTRADRDAFLADPALRDGLLKSFDRFLGFLGLQREVGRIIPGPDFQARRWRLNTPNHNWLRITRVLGSLRLLGLPEESNRFHEGLERLIASGEARVAADTRAYWRHAAFPSQPQ